MPGVHVDLLEMDRVRFDDLDVGEPDRDVVRENDPEMAVTPGLLEDHLGGRLLQDGLGCVASEQPGGGELDRREHPDIPLPCRGDRVPGAHVVTRRALSA
jgi:hypothetical protein